MDDIVGTAVLNGVVAEAKYSNPETLIAAGQKNGVCCLYLNGNDREGHIRVLRYMLDSGLIRKTKSGKLYNISFKYDLQTYAGKYKGSGFTGEIKLADFVDLETGGVGDWVESFVVPVGGAFSAGGVVDAAGQPNAAPVTDSALKLPAAKSKPGTRTRTTETMTVVSKVTNGWLHRYREMK